MVHHFHLVNRSFLYFRTLKKNKTKQKHGFDDDSLIESHT